MPHVDNDGVTIEYETFGDRADPPMLLIMGLTAQMTAWPEELCGMLADRGHLVIRFDNRDCGLSSKTEGEPPDVMALIMAAMQGRSVAADVPYTLSAMVTDGLAVLDDLDIGAAHLVGASMGGMIAQQTSVEHPERALSLTSIMSTTGAPDVGQPTQAAMAALLTPPPTEREAAIERAVEVARVISGPSYDEAEARVRCAAAHDRCFHPVGAAFQMAAITAAGDRTEALGDLSVPTLVIHGAVDPLIQPSGGEATAAAVPGARLMVLDEMGHDLPRALWPEIVTAIADHAAAAAG